jgi:hypothetical protein
MADLNQPATDPLDPQAKSGGTTSEAAAPKEAWLTGWSREEKPNQS